MGFIVAITGGRDFADYARLDGALTALHRHRPITEIRNGGMTGADALSSYWAYENQVDTRCFGAKWATFGRSAGPRRSRPGRPSRCVPWRARHRCRGPHRARVEPNRARSPRRQRLMSGHRWTIQSGRMRWLTLCANCFVTYRTHRNGMRKCPR